MKKRKLYIALISILLTVSMFTGCGTYDYYDDEIMDPFSDYNPEDYFGEYADDAEVYVPDDFVASTAELGVIYDKNNFVVELTGYEDTASKISMEFLLYNNTADDVHVGNQGLAVNGCMVYHSVDFEHYVDLNIAPGKKSKLSYEVNRADFQKYGITDVKKIEMLLNYFSMENYNYTLDVCECVSILTNRDDGIYYVEPASSLYNKDGIVVSFVSFSDNKLTVYVKNGMGRNIDCVWNRIAINDYSIDSNEYAISDALIFTIINDDCMLTTLDFSSAVKDLGLDVIQSIGFTLYGQDSTSYTNEFESDLITVNVG